MLRWFSASANALLIGALLCGSVAAEVSVAPAGKGFDIDVSGQASTTEVIETIGTRHGRSSSGGRAAHPAAHQVARQVSRPKVGKVPMASRARPQ
jgi:hypothetical protein